MRESVFAELRRNFRPEFLNRIDETLLFKPLTLEEIETIVDLLLVDFNKRLADRRVTVTLDAQAKDWVAEKGYDPVFSARPLKRFLQRNIETKLARALIGGEVGEGATIGGDAAPSSRIFFGRAVRPRIPPFVTRGSLWAGARRSLTARAEIFCFAALPFCPGVCAGVARGRFDGGPEA